MVLAAGLGTRLKPYTLQTPKPLIPLLGVPCIEYSLMQLKTAQVRKIVVNVHAHAAQVVDYLSSKWEQVQISDESLNLLGSAGGLRKAISLIEATPGKSEAFFSLNSDVVSVVDLAKLAERHEFLRKKHGVMMTLCLMNGPSLAAQEGAYTEILVDEISGLITGIGSKKTKVPFFTGTAVFETECFRHLTEGVPSEFVPDVLLLWIQKQKVGFYSMDGLWLDIGSPELWQKSHFQLLHEMERGALPAEWKSAILEGMKLGSFSEENGIVDYDTQDGNLKPTSLNYISYKGDRTDV